MHFFLCGSLSIKLFYWMHGELARVLPKIEGLILPWRDKNPNEIALATYQRINHILNDCQRIQI